MATKTRENAVVIRLSDGSESGYASAMADVLSPSGAILCRLNIFQFPGGGGNVDVILDGAQRGRFLSWKDGHKTVDLQTPDGTTVHAVDIRPGGQEAEDTNMITTQGEANMNTQTRDALFNLELETIHYRNAGVGAPFLIAAVERVIAALEADRAIARGERVPCPEAGNR